LSRRRLKNSPPDTHWPSSGDWELHPQTPGLALHGEFLATRLAKFMHFGVFQYFSLINLNRNISYSYFSFYINVYGELNVKNKNNICSVFMHFVACQFDYLAKYSMHFARANLTI